MPTYNNEGNVSYTVGKPPMTLSPGTTGIETTLILDHLPGLVRTADTPRFNLLRDRHDIAFAGAGQETVAFDDPHLVRAILISSTVAVDMFINSIDNSPGKRLLANHEYFLVPGGLIEALVFDSGGVGTVIVEEVGPAGADQADDGQGVTFGGEGVTFGGQGVSW